MHECRGSYLQACLLLLIAEHPGHGYDLATRLSVFGAAEPTTTYRLLRGLERDGAVDSRWTPSHGGPARRIYRLTPAGRAALAASGEQLRGEHQRLSHYLRRLDASCARTQGPTRADPAPGRAHAGATGARR